MDDEPPCANPLFTAWIKELLDQARERNTKGVNAYKKAYRAMRDCPIPFEHPSEAKLLNGIGDILIRRLEVKLKEHCEANGFVMPKAPKGKKRANMADLDGNEDEDSPPPKKAKTLKPYVPALRSGAYAIILALATLDRDDNTGLSKQQVITEGQEYADSSFSVPSQANKHYTAWNSMKTLTGKNLVYEKGRPTKRYLLTPEGWECADRIKAASDPSQGRLGAFVTKEKAQDKSMSNLGNDFVNFETPSPSKRSESPQKKGDGPDIVPLGNTSTLPRFNDITIPGDSFEVRLVLDNREVRSNKDRDYIPTALYKHGVDAIVRPLALGDTIWVAKMKDPELLKTLGVEGDEIVLDYILERKRLDDLVSSIKDGRFTEQKFRLKKAGVKNIIYLIEQFDMHSTGYEQHIQSAIASTQVVNDFFVKKTKKLDDTIKYLARMTKMLQGIYESKPLHVIPTSVITKQNYHPLLTHLKTTQPSKYYHITYPAFASLASKSDSLNLRDVYLKMLMCIKGITGEKAIEIQKRWKTPAEFAAAYKDCGEGEQGRKKKIDLVSGQMENLIARKKVAKVLSVKVAEVWGDLNYEEDKE